MFEWCSKPSDFILYVVAKGQVVYLKFEGISAASVFDVVGKKSLVNI